MPKEILPSVQEQDIAIENLYILSAKRLTMPRASLKKQRAWLDELIAVQREGIDNGIRPQNIRDIRPELLGRWKRQVWGYYRKTLSPKDRVAASQFLEGRELHTHPTAVYEKAPTPLKFRYGKPKK